MNRYLPVRECFRRLVPTWLASEPFAVEIRKNRSARRSPSRDDLRAAGADRAVLTKAIALLVLLLMTGCASPAARQMRLVSKPNMTFSDSVAFSYNSSRLLPQLATGFSAAGGPQNSGCTSCR